MKGEHSLRRRSLGIFFMALAAILGIQTLYFFNVLSTNRRTAAEYADFSAQQVSSVTQQLFDNYHHALWQLGQSRDVQNLLVDSDPYSRYLDYNAVSEIGATMIQVQEGVSNILLIQLDGDTAYYYTPLNDQPLSAATIGIEESDLLRAAENTVYSTFLVTQDKKKNSYLCCIRPVIGTFLGKNFGQLMGYSLLILNEDTINGLFWEKEDQGIFLLDQNDRIIFPATNSSVLVNDFSRVEKMNYTGWKIVVNLNPHSLMRHYFSVLLAALGTALTMVFLLVCWFVFNQQIITRPLLALNKEIGELDRNGLSGRLSGRYPGEIGMMARSINHLLDRLQQMARHIFQLQDQMYETELREKETRLYALQAQVNPHFLFNTLQCIAGIAAAHEDQAIVNISLSLSRIFHYVARQQGNITVRQELSITEEYLKIIEVRFMGQYKYKIEVDDALLDIPCQKMIFQPLVENAVLHGLENTYREGLIQLYGVQMDNKAVFTIIDNGCGISADQLSEIRKSFSDPEKARRASVKTDRIGLANIQSRIQAIYGAEYGLQIDSIEGEGTTVTVTLPVKPDAASIF